MIVVSGCTVHIFKHIIPKAGFKRFVAESAVVQVVVDDNKKEIFSDDDLTENEKKNIAEGGECECTTIFIRGLLHALFFFGNPFPLHKNTQTFHSQRAHETKACSCTE